MPGPVVVGVDGTEETFRAVRWAAAHADRHGTGVRLVHAVEHHRDPAGVLRAALAAVTAAGLPVTATIGDVSAAELLVRESAGASLVVLGTQGHGGFSGRLIGVAASTVAARGSCPMTVVGGAEPMAGPVVVGVDGTPTSDAAVDFALREASLRGTDLLAVHGLVDPVSATVLDPDRAHELVAERLAHLVGRYPEVKVTQEEVRNKPGAALVEYGAGAQLVVVGSSRRIGKRGLVLRSTGQHLLYRAPCPIAVVRSDHAI